MSDIFDVDPLDKFMGLFVGPNGSGKSIAIASWMEKGSIEFFDYDGRMASVANWYKQRGLKRGQLHYTTYGPSNIYDAYAKLSQYVDSCPHAAIVIDSFTAVTVAAVTFSIRRRTGKSDIKALPKTSKGDMIIPDWDEWNGEAMYVTMLLDLCKQIAANGTAVFWTAHPVQRTVISSGQGTSVGSVKVQTKYAAFGMKSDSLIPIYFNEIYYFTTDWDYDSGTAKRVCYTQPNSEVAAKTALNIPPIIEWTNKNFYSIFSAEVAKGQAEIEARNKVEENTNEVVTVDSNSDSFTTK
jgi:hypothetical protein